MITKKILPEKETSDIGEKTNPYNNVFINDITINDNLTVNGELNVTGQLTINADKLKIIQNSETLNINQYIENVIKNYFVDNDVDLSAIIGLLNLSCKVNRINDPSKFTSMNIFSEPNITINLPTINEDTSNLEYKPIYFFIGTNLNFICDPINKINPLFLYDLDYNNVVPSRELGIDGTGKNLFIVYNYKNHYRINKIRQA